MDIVVDWSGIESEDDFYDVVFERLDAPYWHGRNLNALSDSVVVGGINGVEPPYRFVFLNGSRIRAGLAGFAGIVREIVDEAAREREGVTVSWDAGPGTSAGRRD